MVKITSLAIAAIAMVSGTATAQKLCPPFSLICGHELLDGQHLPITQQTLDNLVFQRTGAVPPSGEVWNDVFACGPSGEVLRLDEKCPGGGTCQPQQNSQNSFCRPAGIKFPPIKV